MEQPLKYILPGNLVTYVHKYEQTVIEINAGELSYSYSEPCTVTYLPEIKKYLIQDGNHRAIQKTKAGQTKILCKVNPHQKRSYYAGKFITINKKKTFNT